jgi:hypothetical protein
MRTLVAGADSHENMVTPQLLDGDQSLRQVLLASAIKHLSRTQSWAMTLVYKKDKIARRKRSRELAVKLVCYE